MLPVLTDHSIREIGRQAEGMDGTEERSAVGEKEGIAARVCGTEEGKAMWGIDRNI